MPIPGRSGPIVAFAARSIRSAPSLSPQTYSTPEVLPWLRLWRYMRRIPLSLAADFWASSTSMGMTALSAVQATMSGRWPAWWGALAVGPGDLRRPAGVLNQLAVAEVLAFA